MSLKRFYYNKDVKSCYTCMFIDEYAFNVHGKGEVPHGYDGTALCCKFDDSKPETKENRMFVSPCWVSCEKYKNVQKDKQTILTHLTK